MDLINDISQTKWERGKAAPNSNDSVIKRGKG